MQPPTIDAERRADLGSNESHKLRRRGRIPTVLYGDGQETIHLHIDAEVAQKQLGKSPLLQVRIDDTMSSALIQEVQHHPVTDEILHVDLLRVSAEREVHIEVRLRATGIPIGLKAGGQLEQELHEVMVWCLPHRIPDRLTYDVSKLELNESVHIKHIPLPEGVRIDDSPETLVAMVRPLREIEEAAVPTEAPTTPEVISARPEDKTKTESDD